jgi:hypothetical protein
MHDPATKLATDLAGRNVMRNVLMLTPLLLLALLPAAVAQTTEATTSAPATATSKQEPAPSYSKQTLMRIFVEEENEDDENAPKDPFDVGVTYTVGNTRLHWVPFVAPFFVGATMPGAHVAPTSSLTIDPFNLLHTEAAYTSTSIQDPLKQWKFRRMLTKNEKAAKRARGDN